MALGCVAVQLHHTDRLYTRTVARVQHAAPLYVPEHLVSMIGTIPETFRVFQNVVRAIGGQFKPFLTEQYETITLPAPQAEDPVPPATRGKRPRRDAPVVPQVIRRRVFKPDPFMVTALNLERTVASLADEDCPVDLRRYFEEYNPLPNAVWSEEHLLLTPDEVMACILTDYPNKQCHYKVIHGQNSCQVREGSNVYISNYDQIANNS